MLLLLVLHEKLLHAPINGHKQTNMFNNREGGPG